MARKDRLDAFGAVALVGFSAIMGLNQAVIAVVNEGLQPVFFAGLRSLLAALLIFGVIRAKGLPVAVSRAQLPSALLMGALFAFEFLALFVALDMTTVTRSSILFYSMPLWTALGAHFLVQGEGIGGVKALGLALAFAGVAWGIAHRGGGGEASLPGDLLALAGAILWAALALTIRLGRIRTAPLETQLFWQLAVSGPILMVFAPLFGPFIRDFQPVHLWGIAFQVIIVASGIFLFWLWLLARYPATSVTSFSFLSPIFGALSGWLLLAESTGPALWQALALVAAGIFLINRPPRQKPQVPQKV